MEINKAPTSTSVEIRDRWGNLGEAYLSLELQLQAKAQAILLKLPTEVTDIPAAEVILKELKRTENELEGERKAITSKFDLLTKRLMKPENSLQSPIVIWTNKIISAKKLEQEEANKQKEKTDQLRQCREYLISYKNGKIQGFNKLIIDTVDKAYTWALGEGNVSLDQLPEWLTKTERRLDDKFVIYSPLNMFSLVTKEEFDILVIEQLTHDPTVFITDYATKLRFKFSDYEIALNNKLAALENARKEKEAAEKALADKKLMEETVAKLQAAAIIPNLVPSTKPLKSEWKVDNVMDLQNSVLIMTAFISNLDKCHEHVTRVSVWSAFTINQMATCLAKVKTQDPAFAPQGIIFKTIDKL